MKTLRTLLFLSLAAIVLYGCGSDSDQDSAETGTNETESSTTETTTESSNATDEQSTEVSRDASAAERVEAIDEFELRWAIEGENIRVSVSAPTTGWIAVGFDPDRMMQGANIIIGYVANGEAVVTDQWGTRTIDHGLDTENGGTDNIIDFSGSETDGETEIQFTIPLDSGDDTDKPLSIGSEYVVILAYGSQDDLESYHAHRTSARITL